MMHSEDEQRDEELARRLAAAREYSKGAAAPERLWSRILAALDGVPTGKSPSLDLVLNPHGGVRRRRWSPSGLLAAASVVLAAGFGLGRATAPQSLDEMDDKTTAVAVSPALEVQESGARMVRALDGLASLGEATLEAAHTRREVALVALGAVLAAGTSEYPQEVDALLMARREVATRAARPVSR